MPSLAAAQRRHLAYYREAVRELAARYQAGDRVGSVAAFEADWTQLQQAQAAASELEDGHACFLLFVHARSFLELRRSPAERLLWFEAAEPFAAEADDPAVEAEFLALRGNIAFESGDFEAAGEWYRRVFAAASALRYRALQAGAAQSLGNVRWALQDYPAAAGWYHEALEICREAGDRRGEGVNLGSLGTVHADQGDHEAAVGFFERAIEILEPFEDAFQLETFVGNLGNSRSALGDHEGALRDLHRALELAERFGDLRAIATRSGNLASAYGRTGMDDPALDLGRRAVRLAREAGSEPETGSNLARLAQIHYWRNERASALDCFEQAQALFAALGMAARAGDMERNVARLRFELHFDEHIGEGNERAEAGDPVGARRKYLAALELARAYGHNTGEATALGNVGFAHLLAGELDQAQACLADALRISEGLSDGELRARHLTSLGNVAQMQGDHGRAAGLYRRARELYRQSGERAELGVVAANLGGIALQSGAPDEARECFLEALACFRASGRHQDAVRMEAELRSLAHNPIGPDEAARFGIDAMNAGLGGSLLPVTLTLLDGRRISGSARAWSVGGGDPVVTLELADGSTHLITFGQVASITARHGDGTITRYGSGHGTP